MKVLIVEDETAAYDNLVEILAQLDPLIEVVGNTESVNQTVRWLEREPAPELIFMDINLSDGSAFAIFDRMKVTTPIVFVTAYDQFAIDAFKVNSIDYLLKPVNPEDVAAALEKFKQWGNRDVLQYISRLSSLSVSSMYRDRVIVQMRDKLLPICVDEVAYFYSTNRRNVLVTRDGQEYPSKLALDQMMASLNPVHFIRANKQFILNRDFIKEIVIWFDNRLKVNMTVEVPEPIFISKNKAVEFKKWVEKT
ncbi:MAG: response regulator transcription factor [Bacteroidaceae bacterium]|nr:response regulator transcription factor [Bacteroidaceae bacterium]